MQVQLNVPLAQFTSFAVGGPAQKLITLTSNAEFEQAINEAGNDQLWLLGHGTNVLISDQGLSGTTIRFTDGNIIQDGNTLIADAGVAWDKLVQFAIEQDLWGIELTSGVPGSVGAAVYINITAYGQSNSNFIRWVEVYDKQDKSIKVFQADELHWDYKQSVFQEEDRYVILRAAYELDPAPTGELTYNSALEVAEEVGLKPATLKNRRAIILETRKRAGSLFAYNQGFAKTVGSFFRNPVVTDEQLETIAQADELHRPLEEWKSMNQANGGRSDRMSAAVIMLAAGYQRGQSWGPVRLHPDHVLKLENAGGATAQQIYDVAQEIINTVESKLGVKLEPEAKILGVFR